MTDLAFFTARLVTEWGELLAEGGGDKMVLPGVIRIATAKMQPGKEFIE